MEREGATRGRGRPRLAAIDDAIHAATWDVIARAGYTGLTFEAVAEAAGCTRMSLYRRFSSKAELVGATMFAMSRAVEPVIPDDVAPLDALMMHAQATVDYLSGDRGTAILSLISASARSPELRAISEEYERGEREYFLELFREMFPDSDAEQRHFAFDSYIGLMLQHVVIRRTPMTPEKLRIIIDSVLKLLAPA